MGADLIVKLREPFSNLLKRPLSAREFAIAAGAMLAAGTVYCQLWCLIALTHFDGKTMPLEASIYRAFLDIVPAFLAFELSKRVPIEPRRNLIFVVLIFITALAVATALRMGTDVMTSEDPSLRVIAAHRVMPLAVAAVLLAWFHLSGARAVHSGATMAVLPPAKSIEWVKAAGNYVEVRFAGRTRLLRMTLRQAANQLPPDQFVQVHRSAIVNRAAIAGQPSRAGIRMSDGTEFRVGDAYRSNLER